MIDHNDFSEEGIEEMVRHFEQLLNSGNPFFYDSDELGQIIDFYIDFEEISKANKAINYAESIYPFELFYKIKKAEVCIAERNIKAAIRILEESKQLEPNNPEIAKLLGDCHTLSLHPKRAIDCYQFALNNGAEKEEMLLRLARVYFATDNQKKALYYINAFPQNHVYDDFSIQEFIKLFFDFSQYEGALVFLEKVINQTPYQYTAWYFTGLINQKLERYEDAVNAYEFCIAIDETNTMGHLGKGNSLMEMDRFEEAIACFKLSIDNDISDAEVYCNIAECHENLNDYNSAKYYYQKSIKTDKQLSDAFFGLAMMYKREEKLLEAERNLQKAIDLDNFESLYHIELAEIYLLNGQQERCYYHYHQASDIDQETAEVILDFSHACAELDDLDKAIELLKTWIKNVKPDHRILYRLASYLLTKGSTEEGYNYLHLALQMEPEEHILLFAHAPFLESVENVSNIIDLYTK